MNSPALAPALCFFFLLVTFLKLSRIRLGPKYEYKPAILEGGVPTPVLNVESPKERRALHDMLKRRGRQRPCHRHGDMGLPHQSVSLPERVLKKAP